MTSLEAFSSDDRPRSYCLVCQHVIQIGRKGIRVVNLETYACCGLSHDVLAVRKEQGVRAPLPAVHGACYINQLQPRLRVLREQAAAVPRTRAAVKSLPPEPARRAPAGAEQRLVQLQNESAHITGVLPSASQRRTAACAQATSMLRLAGEQAPAGAAGGGVTRMETSPQESPERGGVAALGAGTGTGTAGDAAATTATGGAGSPAAGGGVTHMETSPQESPGRGGVAAPGACTSSSGHTGVSWDNSKQAYRARSSCKLSGVSGQPRHLGHYPTSHDAAAAVNLYHEVLARCLTWGVEVEPPPNAVPAGVALGRAEEAYVRSCALNAELDFWRAKEAALTAQLTAERRSSCTDYLTACQLVPELASFVTTIATGGVLPGDLVVEYAMDAVTNAAKLREGGPAANGVRWRSRIKVVAAAAAAQCSGEATLNVLRGDVKDPGLPFPSTSTNRRTMGEDGVVPDATVGVLPTGIRKFVARCHVAGRPNADACMGTDGVDIPALLEKEVYPSGVRFAGDACLGDSVGVAALAEKEREYNSLVSRLDSSAAVASDAAVSHASVQHVAAWVQREVLPRARTSLREAQVASEAQDARFQRTNGGAMEAGEQQRLKQQQVVHKCASLQRVERAQTVVSLAEGLVRGAQRMHGIQLVSVTVGVLSPEGRITVALTPAGSDAEAACAEAVMLLARDMRAALPQLYDVLRRAATSMVVAFLTSPDSSVSELVARMYVGGKASEQMMRRLIADVAVALATEAQAQQKERRLAEKERRRQEEERLQQLQAKAAPQAVPPVGLPAAQQAAALPAAAAAEEEEPRPSR